LSAAAGARPRLFVAEPSPAYRVRPPLVVDCSVLVAALFLEPELGASAQMQMQGHELHAPRLLGYEFANVAVKKAAAGAEPLARAGIGALASTPLTLHDVDPAGSFHLARQYSLSAYDAAYLWLAAELRCSLATFDRRLAQAGRNHLRSI